MTAPQCVKMRAIDIELYRYGLWCSHGDGKPFVNDIVYRKWGDNGKIIFGLESHNFWFVDPFEMVEVVPIEPSYVPKNLESATEFAARQPNIVNMGAGI